MGEQRLLLAGGPAWGYVVPARAVLVELRQPDRGFADWILVHRERAGLEQTCARWWRELGGRTEVLGAPVCDVRSRRQRTLDPTGSEIAAAGKAADACLAFIADRDPWAMDLMLAAMDHGAPVILHYEGRYPYRPGTLHAEGKHPAQIAARRRERNADIRHRVQAAKQARGSVA